MAEVFAPGAENPQLASSREKPTRISADPHRDGLLRRYLFASDEKTAEDALDRLTIDGRRAAIGGMTPRERGLAENIDRAREAAPVVAANVGVAGAAGLASYAAPELRPYLGGAAGAGFLAGAGIEVAANTLIRMETRFPRVAEAAKRIAAGRLGKWIMMLSVSGGLGTVAGGFLDSYLMARAAAQQAGAGELPPRSDWVEEARAQGWPSAEQRFQAGGGAEELRAQGWQPLGGQPPPAEQPPVEAVTPHLPQVPVDSGEAELQAALEVATKVVEVQPGDTLTDLVSRAGGDAYGADFTNTVLQSADVLTGPQNPNRDMAQVLIEFIKAHPDGVNWRDAINGVGEFAKEVVGGVPLKDAIAQATRMIYPGQEIKIVVGAGVP